MPDADAHLKDRLLNDLSSSVSPGRDEPLPDSAAPPPTIPDHTLLRQIGKGSYGEVWLARSVLGTPRAVKIVRRSAFDSDRPYEREFAGIRRFEPVSRSHPSQLNILHVGRDDAAGYFYYVMELADNGERQKEEVGSKKEEGRLPKEVASTLENPTSAFSLLPSYFPRTLRSELQRRGTLPYEECLSIATALATALDHLHRHGLVHRDIKPSNIIFVNGIPKLADIGLVTHAEGTLSFVGTEGFVPPEGPGTVRGDIYSLGKVLYEIATGRDRQEYPELPTNLIERSAEERAALAELNSVIVRACEEDSKSRYATAAELHADLALLQSGGSVRRQRKLAGQLRVVQRAGAVVTAMAAVIASGWWWQATQTRTVQGLVKESHKRLLQLQTANGIRAMDNGDPATAAVWFSEVLRQSAGDAVTERRERFRLGSLLRHLPKPVALFRLEPDLVSVNMSADGKRLVGVSKTAGPGLGQGEIREWELPTSRLVRSISLTNIWSVRISPSGRWAVVTDPTGNRLYEASDELRLVTHLPFGGGAEQLGAFSQDETKLAICSSPTGREVQLLEIPSGRLLAPPLVHSHDVVFLAFDPAGRQLLTGTRVEPVKTNSLEVDGRPTGQARVWNASTGEPITDWLASDEEVRSATFRPDGKALAIVGSLVTADMSGSEDHHVKVVDLTSGDLSFPPLAHQDTVLGAAFSPDGRLLATAGADRSVRLWDARTGELTMPPFKLQEIAIRVGFSPDGRWLAAGCETEVRVWDARSGELVVPPLKQGSRTKQLTFSSDGRCLLVATSSGSIHVWNLAVGQPAWPAFPSTDGRLVTSVAFSPDGQQLVTTEATGELQVWNTGNGQPTGPAMVPEWEIRLPAIFASTRSTRSADGRFLAVPAGDGTVRIWDAHTHQPHAVLLRPGDIVASAEFSPVTGHLVTGCRNGNVRVWDTATGKPVTSEMRHGDSVEARYSPDGRRLATASLDGTARIWDALTGEPLSPPLKHPAQVYAVVFSPDGQTIATGGSEGGARIWDVNTGQPSSLLMKHLHGVVTVCFSPSGKQLLTTSIDRTARVWDVETGNSVTPPLTHNGFVVAGAFSRDGSKVITGSYDGTARVWDAVTGEPLCMPLRHRQAIHDVAFSPDGRLVATASRDGTAQLWEVPNLELPAAEIASLAQLYAGVALGPVGNLEPLVLEERAALSESTSRLIHDDQANSADERIRWHQRRLAESQRAMDWSAAEFHARHLVELVPDDAQVRADLDRVALRRPQPREADTPPDLIDLSSCYNASLRTIWHPGPEGNDLSELPRGVQMFAGTRFDVRGLIQVFSSPGSGGYHYPKEVRGIALHRKVDRLHFLQSIIGGTTASEGARVGHYVIHFANGRSEPLDIISGRDGRDWHEWPGEPEEAATEAVIAWQGKNAAMADVGTLKVRLFKRTWVNPTPEVEVTTIDLVADHPTAFPFIVALTAE